MPNNGTMNLNYMNGLWHKRQTLAPGTLPEENILSHKAHAVFEVF